MDLGQAFVLGLVQALTEFLPVSSSGHLILVPALLGWPEHDLAFDVALHVGTAAALLAYFWRDWWALAQVGIRGLIDPVARNTPEWRLGWLILAASLPAVLAGLLLGSTIEQAVRGPQLVAAMLIGFGVLIGAADHLSKPTRTRGDLGWSDALLIGAAQAVALVPGVSRSGITIAAALALGFRRADAARLSFLMGTPLILGAGVSEAPDVMRQGLSLAEVTPLLVGMATAGLVGALVISGMLRFVARYSLDALVAYRILAGISILALGVG